MFKTLSTLRHSNNNSKLFCFKERSSNRHLLLLLRLRIYMLLLAKRHLLLLLRLRIYMLLLAKRCNCIAKFAYRHHKLSAICRRRLWHESILTKHLQVGSLWSLECVTDANVYFSHSLHTFTVNILLVSAMTWNKHFKLRSYLIGDVLV